MAASSKEFFTEKRIRLIIKVFTYFYIASAGFLLLAGLVYLSTGNLTTTLGVVPSLVVACVIAYGLYKHRVWVSIVITLLAAFGVFSNALRIPTEPVPSILFIAILVFELYFFNRQDVKAKLNTKSKTLI